MAFNQSLHLHYHLLGTPDLLDVREGGERGGGGVRVKAKRIVKRSRLGILFR